MLLGAEIYFDLLQPGQIRLGNNLPIMQNTVLGWIIAGSVDSQPETIARTFFTMITDTLDDKLTRFWEIETISEKARLTKEERECEDHFKKSVRRTNEGRYVVKLPMRSNDLGESYNAAYKQFVTLERRLQNNPELHEQYSTFMNEYENLGHMEVVQEPTSNARNTFYLPHHPVFKESSTTTKLRVVFNASSKSSNNKSLNDMLMVGPVLYEDLFSIVTRFRCYKIAMTADIMKMYRQIIVDTADQNYQRILWRQNPTDELKTYRLKTVTYGTASAPYLATKCLQQLADDEQDISEHAKYTIKHNFYVDDLMSGTDSVPEALELQTELIETLRKGGFELHKWSSNSSALLENVTPTRRETELPLAIGKDSIKTLGLLWSPHEDVFRFVINLEELKRSHIINKRRILSDVASIFDPLGILGPIVVKAKIFIQQLWKEKATWDEPLNTQLVDQWLELRAELNQLQNFRIDRLITNRGYTTRTQIHGFSDASELAYGACVYLRTEDEEGLIHVNLIASKSRVAPIKQVSLPRLELCGALTLARLVSKIKASLTMQIEHTHLWCDSTVTLAWLQSTPARWKTFVANRVSEAQELTEECTWNHVPTDSNPADYISRGQSVECFSQNNTWIHGPSWLKQDSSTWPQKVAAICNLDQELMEVRVTHISYTCVTRCELFDKFSSISRLQRTLAYCLRFINNALLKPKEKTIGSLTTRELNNSLMVLVKQAQLEDFQQELKRLKSNKSIKQSCLVSLNPFLDKNDLLRVGGRLQNSALSYNQKHPIILPSNHTLTKLLITQEHQRTLHAGTQATLASLRQKFWPINGRNTTRKIIHNCITCCRFRLQPMQPIMGNLPKYRTTPSRAFAHTGIDYAGPFSIKISIKRTASTAKAYIALFVCLSTRALHIELVSSLTTAAFISALRRFTARRGKSVSIHSDNGTNFKGAHNELNALFRMFNDTATKNEILDFAANEGIQWNFIPPRAPNFGGLWEAGVKSVKNHLKRIIGNTVLTFEEMQTLLTQIEACLNSRPLVPISDDPTDNSFLTPAHFLIGDSLTTYPEPDLTDVNLSRLSRWQLVQRQTQTFWKQWSKEYLQNMQQRHRWNTTSPNVHMGALVLIKEDNQPPLNWARGRIIELHPGKDNIVRVVSVKSTSGTFKRPVNKLCLLPIQE